MGRIILSSGKNVLRELSLVRQRTTIGRALHNDLILDDPAISAEHAVIGIGQDGAFLEDLNSTNGTQINGQPIHKHFLQDGDVIKLAIYQIRYFADDEKPTSDASSLHAQISHFATGPIAKVKVLSHPANTKEIVLAKPLTTIGVPGAYVAIVREDWANYVVKQVEGTQVPAINGKQMKTHTEVLKDGDTILCLGIEMRFYLG